MGELYLKRKIDLFLSEWKKNPERKPLIVKGPRQVGKTESIRRFADQNYESVIYMNFVEEPKYKLITEDGYRAEDIIKNISRIDPSKRFQPEKTVIIFDEIQDFASIATSLKFFKIDGRFDVICSGSLLGINYREIESNSVGYKTDYTMSSLDFEEFLTATGNDLLIDEITECYTQMSPINEGLHQKALDLYHDYLIIGGMPEAVKAFIETNSYIDASLVQSSIIDSYTADMAKYASNSEAVKIRACYNSIPAQLAKDNKKFQYKVVQKGGSSSIFGASLEWLKQAGVILECQRVDQGNMPLPVYADQTSFKIYMSDVGLLVNKSQMSVNTIITGESNIFMGAVTENYIAQQLASKNYPLYYWTVANSQAELDFVLQKNDKIYAIEVKKGEHVRSRSLSVFKQKYSPDYAIRFSQKNFGKTEDVISIPLYAAFLL